MNKHQFLWLDLETTGLDPHRCRILEWAAVLAADDRSGDMSPIEQYTSVIGIEPDAALAEMDDYVRTMHSANGLLDECRASNTTLRESEDFLIALVEGEDTRGVILAGASVHFDLAFLRVHMPRFARCLSHRVLDVRALKIADATWGVGTWGSGEGESSHRALADILATLGEAKVIRDRVWR